MLTRMVGPGLGWVLVLAVLVPAGCTSGGSGTGTREASRASISGTIHLVDEPGLDDMSRVQVSLGRGEGTILPDDEGNFTASDLEPDVYTVTVTYVGGISPMASRSAYQRLSQRVVARAGGDVNLGVLAPELATGTVRGSINAMSEAPGGDGGAAAASPAGTEVVLQVRGVQRRAVVGEDGLFEFTGVPVGLHTVNASKPSFLVPQAQGCSAQAGVGAEEDVADVGGIPLVQARPTFLAANGQTLLENGLRWLVAPGVTAVDVNVAVAAASRARAWRDGETPPEPVVIPAGERPSFVLPLSSTTADLEDAWLFQFGDACGAETSPVRLVLVVDRTAPVINSLRFTGTTLSSGEALSSSTTVGWDVDATDAPGAPLSMRTRTCVVDGATPTCGAWSHGDDDTWGPFQRTGNSITFAGNGLHRLEVQVRDASRNMGSTASADVRVLADAPGAVSVRINGGAATVTSLDATVEVEVTGGAPVRMRLYEGTTAGTAPWTAFTPVGAFRLAPGSEGARQVTAEVMDALGRSSSGSATVTYVRRGSVSGRVALGSGAPAAGARVSVVSGPEGAQETLTADATGGDAGVDGAFAVAGALGGPGTITVEAPAGVRPHDPVQVSLRVEPGSTVDLGVLVLAPQTGRITGQVTLAGETDHAGTIIVFREVGRADARQEIALTSADGSFQGPALAVGTWSVSAQRQQYTTQPLGDVLVARNGTTALAPAELRRSEGSIILADGAAFTRTRTVSVKVRLPLVTTGGVELRLAEDPDGVAAAMPSTLGLVRDSGGSVFEVTTTFTLSAEDGIKRVYGALTTPDVTGYPVDGSIILDATPPDAASSVVINGGNVATRVSTVVLALSGVDNTSGVHLVRLSTTPTGGTTVPFTSSRTFDVDPALEGDGVKTVYAWFVDRAGNESVAPATAQVLYDRVAPVVQPVVVVGARGGNVAQRTVSLRMDARDACATPDLRTTCVAGNAPPLEMRLAINTSTAGSTTDADLEGTAWEPYATPVLRDLPAADRAYAIHARFRDHAGNESTAVPTRVTLDTVAPGAPTVTLNGGVPYVRSASVSLRVEPAQGESAEGYTVHAAGDLAGSTQGWAWTDAARTLELAPGAGTRTVHVTLVDAAGNASPAGTGTVEVVLDPDPPVVGTLVIGDGSGFTRDAQGITTASVACADALAPDALLDLRVTDAGGTAVYDGAYLPTVVIALGTAEGPRTLTATCTDPAGNSVTSGEASVVVDRAGPTLVSFLVNGGVANAPTREPVVTAAWQLADTMSGGVVVALSDAPMVCATATYAWPGTGAASVVLGGADGSRSVHLCARDAAGNLLADTSVASSNAVLLDRVAPAAPTVSLQGGDAFTASALAALRVVPAPGESTSGYRMTVTGDVVATVDAAWQQDSTVTLSGGSGTRVVRVGLQDAAGNLSPEVTAQVTLDATGPVVGVLTVGDGSGYERDPTGVTTASIPCVDALAPESSLELRITDSMGATAYDGPYLGSVVITLGTAQGMRTVTATCTDAAGNATAADAVQVTLDTVAPVVGQFILNGGTADEPTRNAVVTATYAATDATSGGVLVAVGTSSFTCATATYTLPGSGTAGVALPGADGSRSAYLCARDAAGNLSASTSVASTNTVLLDRTPPDAGFLVLAGNAAAVRVRTGVGAQVTGTLAGNTLVLSGDVDGSPVTVSPAVSANTVTLTTGDGTKRVRAVLRDAAGNESAPFEDAVDLDTSAPSAGNVTLANGASVVTESTIPVRIENTLADTMMFQEAASAAACAVPACGTAGFASFAPLTSLTFQSTTPGTKTVCWRFCDAAGNSVTGSGSVAYGGRPRPVLESVSPEVIVARSDNRGLPRRLVITGGTGSIAADTVVLVGDFQVACSHVNTASSSCSAASPSECASACETDVLPDAVINTPGVYSVRLFTPDPVIDGNGTSAVTAALVVQAPVPAILGTSMRGVEQFASSTTGALGQSITVDVCGRCLVDNASWQLGGNAGTPAACTVRPEWCPDLPSATDNCQEELDCVTVAISTADMLPLDAADYAFRVTNPSPGGGTDSVAFGINPRPVTCIVGEPCASNMRATRAALDMGAGVVQAFSLPDISTGGWLSVMGADAVGITADYGAVGNPSIIPIARLGAGAAMVRLPNWRAAEGVRLESATGHGPRVVMHASRVAPVRVAASPAPFVAHHDIKVRYPTGGAPAPLDLDNVPVDAAVTDVDGNGLVDIVVAGSTSRVLRVLLATGRDGNDTTVGQYTTRAYPVSGTPTALAVADLDGDALVDVAVATSSHRFALVRFNQGNGLLGDETTVDMGRLQDGTDLADHLHALAVGDVNADGIQDLVATVRGRDRDSRPAGNVTVRPGLGGGRFAQLKGSLDVAVAGWEPRAVAVADRDLDHRPEMLVLGNQDSAVELAAYTLGATAPAQVGAAARISGSTPGVVRRMRVADVDGDGRPDVVAALSATDPDTGVMRAGHQSSLVRFRTRSESVQVLSAADNLDSVELADITGDGVPEEIWAEYDATGPAALMVRDVATGSTWTAEDLSGSVTAPVVLVADLGTGPALATRPDGLVDVAVMSAGRVGAHRLGVYRRDDTGPVVTGRASVDLFSVDVAVTSALGDLDGDGDPDLVAGFETSPPGETAHLRLLANTAASFGGGTSLGGGFRVSRMVVRDLNADGCPDLAGVSSLSAGMRAFIQDSDAAGNCLGGTTVNAEWNDHSAPNVGGLPVPTGHAVAVADVTGDGIMDLLRGESSNIVVYRGGLTGAPGSGGRITRGMLPAGGGAARVVHIAVGDLNGDGRPDLVALNAATGSSDAHVLTWAAAQAGGTFDAPQAISGTRPLVEEPTGMVVDDFNGDGRTDVVYASRNRGVVLLSNMGGGAFTATELMGAVAGGVAAADLNGDGQPDVVVRDSAGNVRPFILARKLDGTVSLETRGAQLVGTAGDEALHARDLDGNGAVDIMGLVPDEARMEMFRAAPPAAARMTLRSQAAANTAAPLRRTSVPGGRDTRLTFPSAGMVVQDMAATLRLEGAGVPDVRVELVTPDGATVLLRQPQPACGGAFTGTVAVRTWTTSDTGLGGDAPCNQPMGNLRMDELRGRRGGGDWNLLVTNTGTRDLAVVQAMVIPTGLVDGPGAGGSRGVSVNLRDAVSITTRGNGAWLARDTTALDNQVQWGGGNAAPGPARMVDLEYRGDAPARLNVLATADFDVAVEVRLGRCGSSTALPDGRHEDLGGTNRNAMATPVLADRDLYCLVIAGESATDSGPVDVAIRTCAVDVDERVVACP